MAVPPPSKAELRSILKDRRQTFVSAMIFAQRNAAAHALAGLTITELSKARTIAAFLPIGSEIDPQPLIDALVASGKRIALPFVAGPRDPMRFLAWSPGDPLVARPMGLRQPDPTAETVSPDTILTPLLGFDGDLHRIGYGAGHYDRAFAAHPGARRIGLAWSCQRVERLPVDPWDVPLHAVATEREWIDA